MKRFTIIVSFVLVSLCPNLIYSAPQEPVSRSTGPTFPPNAEPVFDGEPWAIFNNNSPIHIDWPDATSSLTIKGYHLNIKVDGVQKVDLLLPHTTYFQWSNPPKLGLARACVTCEDMNGSLSRTICNSVNLDRVPPEIYMAGYLNPLTCQQQSEFYMLAYVPAPDVNRVVLYQPSMTPGYYVPTSIELQDQDMNSQTSFGPCGFGLGDGFYGLCATLPDGLDPQCLLLGLRAYDHAGNGSLQSSYWPFLEVNGEPLNLMCDTIPQEPYIDVNMVLQINYAVSGGRQPYEVTCDFGDGPSVARLTDARGSFYHTYRAEGLYTALLTVKDADNLSQTCAIPDINVTICRSGKIHAFPFILDSRDMFGDCNISCQANIRCAPASRITWNFGDGTQADGANVSHAYPVIGRYFVTMEAVNANDPNDVFRWADEVYCELDPWSIDCTGVVSPTQRMGGEPLPMTVTFDLSGAIPGVALPCECQWVYGDGDITPWGSQYCRRHTHDYGPGDYTAYLNLRCSDGWKREHLCETGIYVSGPECDHLRSIDIAYPPDCTQFPYSCASNPCFTIQMSVTDTQPNDVIEIQIYFQGQLYHTFRHQTPPTSGSYQFGTTYCIHSSDDIHSGDCGYIEVHYNGMLCYRKGWCLP